MSGNGYRINIMVTITVRQEMEVHGKVALFGLFGAAAGTAASGAAVRLFTTAAPPTTAAPFSAFAS